MTEPEARLARHVAEAADAWLRDPLDAGVYRRLVRATLAWRARAAPDADPAPATVDARGPATVPSPVGLGEAARPSATAPDDDQYLRPDRAPRPVGSALADVASMLRARAQAARSGPVDDAPDDARPSGG